MGAIVPRKSPHAWRQATEERGHHCKKWGSAHRPPVGSVCVAIRLSHRFSDCPASDMGQISFWPSWSTSNWELVFLSVLLFFHCSFCTSCELDTTTQLSTHGKGVASLSSSQHTPPINKSTMHALACRWSPGPLRSPSPARPGKGQPSRRFS